MIGYTYMKLATVAQSIRSLAVIGLLVGAVYAALPVETAHASLADNIFGGCGSSGTRSTDVCQARTDQADNTVGSIMTILLWALGVVAVIVIVIAGFTFVTANGDANRIQKAKNILLYAVIGLIVAVMAYAIIEFVFNRIN